MANEKNYILATLDAETDPFVYYRIPEAFCWGLYTGKNYYEKWGDDSTDQIILTGAPGFELVILT